MTRKEEVLVEEDGRQAPEKYYIKIIPGGPYLVCSDPPIGQEVILSNEKGSSWMYQCRLSFDSSATPVALCRCRHSHHKPFCNSSHKRATNWDFNETNNRRPLPEEAEELEGPAMVFADSGKYYTFARFYDAHGRIWNLVQLAETEGERELIRREITHCPTGRLVVWGKETQKVLKPPFEFFIGIIKGPGIRVSGPI